MRRSHIIVLVLIAACVGVLFISIGNVETYGTFNDAFTNQGKTYHVVGEMNRLKEFEYNPEVDPNLCVFHMMDTMGVERPVHLHQAKPQDIEHSERIVVIGKAHGGEFHASSVLLKCPSKYDDGKPEAVSMAQSKNS